MVPTFTTNRSTREMPSYTPTASPRVRRRHSPWPPHRPIHSGYGAARLVFMTGAHGIPTQIHQIRVGSTLTELQPLVPLVHLLVSLAGPVPSGSTRTSRRCQDCFPPSPASPGSGCPQLQPGCCDSPAARAFHPDSVTVAPRGARTGHRTGGQDRPPPNDEAWPASPLPAEPDSRPGGRRRSAARLAALQHPSLRVTAAALPHVPGSPRLGVLRRLRPTRPVRRSVRLSRTVRWMRATPGAVVGWFPCSLLLVRRRRSPTLPLRPCHGYAADLPHGLPDRRSCPARKLPDHACDRGSTAIRPLSTRFEPVTH